MKDKLYVLNVGPCLKGKVHPRLDFVETKNNKLVFRCTVCKQKFYSPSIAKGDIKELPADGISSTMFHDWVNKFF